MKRGGRATMLLLLLLLLLLLGLLAEKRRRRRPKLHPQGLAGNFHVFCEGVEGQRRRVRAKNQSKCAYVPHLPGSTALYL
jgi:hypothetical protein